MYYLQMYLLRNCPYCIELQNLLKNVNKKNYKIIFVDDDKKEKYKTKFITTFPQIYLKKNNSNGSLLIGGYDDFNFIYNTIKLRNFDLIYNNIHNKYENFSKRSILRIINLFV